MSRAIIVGSRCEVEVDAGGGYVQTARARCELGADPDAALARLRPQMSALARYGSFGFDERAPGDEIAHYFASLGKLMEGQPASVTLAVSFRFHQITGPGGLEGTVEHDKSGYAVTYEWAPIEAELVVDVPGMWRSVHAPHLVSYRPRDGGAYDVTVTHVGCGDCAGDLALALQEIAIGERLPDGRQPRTESVTVGSVKGSGAQWLFYVETKSGGVSYANEYWLTATIGGGRLVVVAKYRSLLDRMPLDDGLSRPNVAELEKRVAPATIRAAALRVAEAYVRAHPLAMGAQR